MSKKQTILRFLTTLNNFSLNYTLKRSTMRNKMLKLGETFKKRRELLGILQPALSLLSGISTRTIQLVEQGKGNPTMATLLQLADSLGLRIELLLKETENSAP